MPTLPTIHARRRQYAVAGNVDDPLGITCIDCLAVPGQACRMHHHIAVDMREQATELRRWRNSVVDAFDQHRRDRQALMLDAAADLLNMHDDTGIDLNAGDVEGLRRFVNHVIYTAGFYGVTIGGESDG